MPTYVYKFIETGETIEVQQSFQDDALTEAVHPERGETMAVKKVFLPVGVTFKGDGFYKTDSRASSKSGGAAAGSSSSSDTSSSSDSSSSSTGPTTDAPKGSSGKSSGSSSSSGTSTSAASD